MDQIRSVPMTRRHGDATGSALIVSEFLLTGLGFNMTLSRGTLRNLFWLVLIAAQPAAILADEAEDEYVRAFPIVGYSQAQAKELKALAGDVSELIGLNSAIEMAHNPVCCVA